MRYPDNDRLFREPTIVRVSRMPAISSRAACPRSQRPTGTSATATASPAAAPSARRRVSAGRDIEEQPPIALDRDRAIRVCDDVLASSPAHLVEVVLAVVRGANRLGDELGPVGRHDDAASDAADDTCGLALL